MTFFGGMIIGAVVTICILILISEGRNDDESL